MKHGKREMPHSRNYKGRTTLIALALIFCCGAGGTLAWLITTSGPVANTFTPTQVECTVDDNYVNHVKSDIKVTNPLGDKNVDAYVRVTFAATWEDSNQNAVAKDTSGFSLPENTNSHWFKGSDGYYYYKNKLEVGETSEPVFDVDIVVPTDSKYVMNVQVLAEAIQADGQSGGTPAVETVWPVTVNGDTLSKKTNS